MKANTCICKIIYFSLIILFLAVCYNSAPAAGKKDDTDLTGPKSALQNAMDELFTLIDTIEKEKGLSQKEKTQKIFTYIKTARWGPEQENYFWIIDIEGNALGDPFCTDLEGKSISNYDIINLKDEPDAEKTFLDLIKECKKSGQAYFQYLKPECKRDEADPKLALARLLAYKDWVIITSIYRDTIEAYQSPVETNFFVPVDDSGPEREPVDDSEPASGT